MSRPADSHHAETQQPAIIDVVEEPIRALTGLRDVTPPPALVARVMTSVSEPAAPTFWQWLRRPFRVEIRVSPLGALGLGVGMALGLAFFVAPRPHPTAVSTLQVIPVGAGAAASGQGKGSEQPVVVRFMLEARGARQVTVAGSFNEWNTDALKLDDINHDGVFVATVPLPAGIHEYMFVVDGEWVTDPAASERRPDGFGRQNALLRL
jgi:hypothetical protein